MPQLLDKLHKDHINSSRVLDFMQQELERSENDADINYNLLLEAVDYIKNYPDIYHHPVEDQVFNKYLEAHNNLNDVINKLLHEHHKMREMTHTIEAKLNAILNDAIINKQMLDDDIREYINIQREHMNVEEREVYPHLKDALKPEHWDQLEQLAENKDPLFDDKTSLRYKSIFNYIFP